MTIQEFQNKVNELKDFEKLTFSSLAKDFANDNLEQVSGLTSEDLGIEDGAFARLYKLEDGYLVIVIGVEEDFSYFEKDIDSAQKIATDKIYELSC